MMLAMEAAPSKADFGRYHLFSSCRARSPAPGSACSARRRSVPTSPVVVVIKHDANELLIADTFQKIAARFVTSSFVHVFGFCRGTSEDFTPFPPGSSVLTYASMSNVFSLALPLNTPGMCGSV